MKINPDIMIQYYDRTLERDLNNFENKMDNNKKVKKYEDTSAFTKDNKVIEDKKLKLLASEFTSILMKQMFKSMRKTVPENKLIDGGFSEEVFTDMFDEELSKTGAEQDGFNSLGRLLYEQLKNK